MTLGPSVAFAGVRALACLVGALALHAQSVAPELLQEMRWRSIGPFRGGRTRAASGVPGQPNVFYMGQVNGGVWKSDDYGRTWNAIFDDQPTQSIGAIAVAPSDPQIVYVASGEGLQRPDLSVGNGIYRSKDGGKTWSHLGLRKGQQIPALAIDPRNAGRLFAAVLGHPYGPNPERGVYVSNDGGATWLPSLQVDENTGACDVEIDPSNPDVMYATLWEARQGPWEFGNAYAGTHGGIFKSIDGGKNWQKLTNGLPAVEQAYVTISASNPRRLYAAAAIGREVQIFRSDDAGGLWTRTTTDPRPAGRIGGGDLPMPRVDPKNPDILYSTSTVTWRSTDAGKTWHALRGAPGGDDYQNLWINPQHPEIILLVSDQGAIVTVNGGRTWSSWYNQPTGQFYHVAATHTFPYRVCGGQQESGSACVASRGNDGEITFRDWHPVGIIEYGYAAPDPLDGDIVYGAGRGNVSRYHMSTGQVEMITPTPARDTKYRTDRTQPIIFSSVDPHLLYYAASSVFKTLDGGRNWQLISPDLTRPHPGIPASLGTMAKGDAQADKQRGVVYSLAPSFRNTATLWAGTDDGLLWVTRDAGKNWKDITPPELTPWSKVTQLEASRFDDVSAYASVSRFRIDDLKPYIYRTHDGGKSWQSITNGLPADAPVDTVREDPVRKGLLYAGTEKAVWVSFDDGDHWQSLQFNLPHTSMRDLVIHDNDLLVGTHGRSFWVLDDIVRLRQVSEAAGRKEPLLFKPAPARRVRWNNNTDTPLPPDEPAGQNPPDGAVIEYYLPSEVTGELSLEIRDAAGKLVRRYSNAEKVDNDFDKLTIPAYWPRRERVLPSSAGAHRWEWDVRYAPPLSTRHEYPIAAVPYDTERAPRGAWVLPGTYTVKLIVQGKVFAEPLSITMDPRVKTSAAGLRQMFDAQRQLSSMVGRTARAIRQQAAIREQIEKKRNNSLEELEKKVREVNLASVNGQAYALYGEIESADVAPTSAQAAALKTVTTNVEAAMKRWAAVIEAVKAANIPVEEANVDEEDGDDDVG